ncbi:PREDICTED: NADH dehydrogenase [ubiquinone] 1 beta subcomplex subunit 5, mitochondrial-like [Nicrophorus vespilloides]|uniref:NADH dehydrogenase [ubiquinone] 1 beta subcomplex subunit 5, mitochondrial n=1 Tax=Nicrophorus vespilloides TaxID=110193 RepID=A0ABM1N4Z1_NICVS|nr:PREDICTED: NADH dehydrogenase [ubiquinone] 1 beta subcomplex subunit 5, mitochondrial-like [Nicrophorus vespilloides]
MIFSALRKLKSHPTFHAILRRTYCDHRTFPLQPSRFQWIKFKDLMYFYIGIGVIPLTIITFVTNVFVGPATLSDIPEDYTPKYWEYYRNPITRVIARYILSDPQQEYEKYLHCMFEESERAALLKIEEMIKNRMEKKCDYQAYYYRQVLAKYYRIQRYNAEHLKETRGD